MRRRRGIGHGFLVGITYTWTSDLIHIECPLTALQPGILALYIKFAMCSILTFAHAPASVLCHTKQSSSDLYNLPPSTAKQRAPPVPPCLSHRLQQPFVLRLSPCPHHLIVAPWLLIQWTLQISHVNPPSHLSPNST